MPLRRCPVFGFGRARGNLHLPLPRLSKAHWFRLCGGRCRAKGSLFGAGQASNVQSYRGQWPQAGPQILPALRITVFVEAEGFPGMALIMGGTLDDTTSLTPTMALFCDSAQPWLAISHEMKSFPRMPS